MPLRLRILPSSAPGASALERASGTTDRTPERTLDFPDERTEIRIGRRPDLELPLPDRALSAVHARLVREGGGWQIEDLGSTNGTRVDGQRLPPEAPRPLAPGARVALGQITFVFEGPVAAGLLGGEGTASIARRLVSDLFAASPDMATPSLTIVGGVETRPPLRLEATDRPYVLGRVETCDLPLGSEEISREHAEIVRLWDRITIRDLDSKNGLRVNGAVVTGRRRLRDGDRIQIGPAVLRLSDPTDRYLRDFEAATEEREDGDEEPPTATEPLAPAPEAVPAGAAPAAPLPSRPGGGSRLAIVVAALVLVIVAGVIATVAFGS
ncbi:MAG TPA: FHA domain-containing protein [Polyangia bacterium]|nr:FHA domain-containing protein [Polyangia bacterium]